MSIVNSEIAETGVMMETDYISIPVSQYEDLIRAETERNILEAAIEGEHRYCIDDILDAIKTARKKWQQRGMLCIGIEADPPTEAAENESTKPEGEGQEEPDDAEACE